MTKWTVRTRATVERFYLVEADDEKSALAASVSATPGHEEDVDEETLEVSRSESIEEKMLMGVGQQASTKLQTLIRTTAHRFENELGRDIRVSVEQHDDERFVIAVEGPDSIATNELTRREADELLMILTVALGTARETA